MSERQPRKSGFSPSPLLLALLLIVATIVVVGAISLFLTGMTAPAPTQTGVIAGASVPQSEPSGKQDAQILDTPTALIPTSLPISTAIPTIVVPTLLAEPTQYIPGPTAQFTIQIPIDQWLVYNDEQAGFSIKYPPDWYLRTTAPEDRVFGSTTQLLSFDPYDPVLESKPPQPIPNFTKIELTVYHNLDATGSTFLAGETIEQWVHRNRAVDESVAGQLTLIEEGNTSIGATPAYYQIIQYASGGIGKTIYVAFDGKLMFVNHRVEPEASFNAQALRQIIESLTLN